MKFMILVKATKDSEAGVMPTGQDMAAMGRYNEELVKAAIMTPELREQEDKLRTQVAAQSKA